MVSEKTVASLLVMLLGKSAPADKPRPVDPPAVERAAPAELVRSPVSRTDLETDFGNLKGPRALARSRALRGQAQAARPQRQPTTAVADRNARLNEHYRQLEASRPRND